jgi:hypothetical protein
MLDCVEDIEKVINQACCNVENDSYASGVVNGLKLQFETFKKEGIQGVKENTRHYYFLYVKELKQYRREYEKGYKDGLIKGEKILVDVLTITC